MKTNKINLNRPIVSSEEINKKQDFSKVINGVNKLKPPLWKKPWFYGPVGLASLALLITLSSKEEQFEKKTTITTNSEVTLPKDTECIHKPIQDLEESSEVFYVDPSKHETVRLSTGTEIIFPEGSLIVENKMDRVKIVVKEYQDQASVFLSGITMDEGDSSAFETAGMIDVSGTQNGKVCSINSVFPIEVKMALTKNPEQFPFWKLDTISKKWISHPVKYSKKQNRNLGIISKNKVQQTNKNIFLLEESLLKNKKQIMGVIIPNEVVFMLPKKGGQQFDLDFNGLEFPELKEFEGMNFEVFTNNNYDKNFTKKTWSDVTLEKEGLDYYANFKSSKELFKIQIRPVLTGGNRLKAKKDFELAMKESKKIKVKLELEKDSLQKELESNKKKLYALVSSFSKQSSIDYDQKLQARPGVTVTRTTEFIAGFAITNFGVYNCDKQTRYPRPFDKEYIFTYNGNSKTDIKNAYVFDQDNDVRYSFGLNFRRPITNLGFFKENESVLVTIDMEGNLGYILKLDEFAFEKEMLKIKKINKKDVNLALIQKLLSETLSEI